MPVMEGTTAIKTAEGVYDFAVDGGAVSTIPLRSPGGSSLGGEIPAGSVITGGYLDVTTAVVGAGASVALNSEGAGDIHAAAAVSGAPWSTTGRKDIVPDSTGSTAIKTTAKRQLAATISAAVLTAGAFRVVVFYV